MSLVPENLAEEIVEDFGLEGLAEMTMNLENSLHMISGFEDALVEHCIKYPKTIWAPLTHTSVAIH